jgi:hypothetical protein
MTIHKLLTTAITLTVLAISATAPVGARNVAGNPTPVTFLRAVEMPGQMLPAGDYVFEQINPESSNKVVLVRNRRGTVQWLGLVHAAERRNAGNSAIQLSEAAAGEAPRVLAWFPTGSRSGAAFIY